MGESMGSPLHGEDHHTRRPQHNRQFLPPSSVPHNMLHASNLYTTSRSATHQVVQPGEIRLRVYCQCIPRLIPGPTKVFKTRRLAAKPKSLLDRGSQIGVVAPEETRRPIAVA